MRKALFFLGLAFSLSAASLPAKAQSALPQPLKPPAATPAAGIAAPAAPSPVATMSESKFLSALYSEIAKHTPETSPAGAGEVTASFHVNASGKIDKVKIDKTTSLPLADVVKQILASVVAPPPPGGGMDVGQTFKFH